MASTESIVRWRTRSAGAFQSHGPRRAGRPAWVRLDRLRRTPLFARAAWRPMSAPWPRPSPSAPDARVCIMGALLPLNNPVRVAEEYALVDAMPGGRLSRGPAARRAVRIPRVQRAAAESRSRFEEAWELVMRAWYDTEPFGWDGEAPSVPVTSRYGRDLSNARCRRIFVPGFEPESPRNSPRSPHRPRPGLH